MNKINFITNQDLGITSGGWSGINHNIHNELSKNFDVNYIGPIEPDFNLREKIYSKAQRMLGLKSDFSFFSDNRLSTIAKKAEGNIQDGNYNFFFGQTPWIDYKSQLPFGVYMDADFRTYLKIFSNPKQFRTASVNRIADKEYKWLSRASHIFIGSEWAWKEMQKHYDLDEKKKVVVHTGGNIVLPKIDHYNGDLNLIFISLNFEKKGGFICYEAFKRVRNSNPNLTLTIIGEEPPKNVIETEGVIYAGLLKKTVKEQKDKFIEILSNAFLLVHPTKMDTMGAVLIEAGYYGCPSIAPNSFGIPELVINGKTGIIIDLPIKAQKIADHIQHLIDDRERYLKMRENAFNHTRANLTWNRIGDKISKNINEHPNF